MFKMSNGQNPMLRSYIKESYTWLCVSIGNGIDNATPHRLAPQHAKKRIYRGESREHPFCSSFEQNTIIWVTRIAQCTAESALWKTTIQTIFQWYILKKKEIATYDSICHRYKNKEYLFSLETDGRRSGALPLHSIRNKFKMLQQPHV